MLQLGKDGRRVTLGFSLLQKRILRLGKKYAGMPLFRAAEMVSQMKGVDGLLIQSSSSAWFGCMNEALRGFVNEVGSRN